MIVYQCIIDGREEIILERDWLILDLFQDITFYSGYDQFARSSKDYKDHYIIIMHMPLDGRYHYVKPGYELIQELIESIRHKPHCCLNNFI